jgi:hypothetical protein
LFVVIFIVQIFNLFGPEQVDGELITPGIEMLPKRSAEVKDRTAIAEA